MIDFIKVKYPEDSERTAEVVEQYTSVRTTKKAILVEFHEDERKADAHMAQIYKLVNWVAEPFIMAGIPVVLLNTAFNRFLVLGENEWVTREEIADQIGKESEETK